MENPIDPEGRRLPIKLDSTSNGEFVPVPLSSTNRAANRLAHEFASEFSKKLSIGRRKFMTSACGAASTLLAFNAANAAAGKSAGFFELSGEASLDLQLARAQLGPAKDEFIFDVQGHFVDTPRGPKPATSSNPRPPTRCAASSRSSKARTGSSSTDASTRTRRATSKGWAS